MKRQTNPKIEAKSRVAAQIRPNTAVVLLFLCVVALSSATAPAIQRSRTLTFADRVAYQHAIEEVNWRHRIWPKERPDPKPPLDKVMSRAEIEKKVEDYLRNSQALEDYGQGPIMAEQLQTEMEQMAKHTKKPEVLREVFAALGNDPFVIAECLARPAIAEQSVTSSDGKESGFQSEVEPRAEAQLRMPGMSAATYTLPRISGGPNGCIDDTWTPTSITNAPSERFDHTAVWTGSEMIIWGGLDSGGAPLITGGKYNPSTDTWTPTSTTNAPTGRQSPAAVWTGSELIVWGGFGTSFFNTGGRYNPSTDTWIATSTTNAPTPRDLPKAVWTGTEMIVWGGWSGTATLNTGGRYNPATNSWIATTTTNAPAARYGHTVVWIGSEMIVWGGSNDGGPYFNTGGRYSPAANSWTATSITDAPAGRSGHTAVWTGSEMIVWAGGDSSTLFNTGGRYNPSTNSWTGTSTTNTPSGRANPTAVWTNNEMIVWGGIDDSFFPTDTGGRYNPSTNSWTATTISNAPSGRVSHTAVWTDNEMIVWGGYAGIPDLFNTGGRYCAQSGSPITLEASVHRGGGNRFVGLTWSPADGGSVNVLRNGVVVHTTDDDGAAQDTLGTHTGTFIYQVCETDSGDCSNEVTVRVRQTGD